MQFWANVGVVWGVGRGLEVFTVCSWNKTALVAVPLVSIFSSSLMCYLAEIMSLFITNIENDVLSRLIRS